MHAENAALRFVLFSLRGESIRVVSLLRRDFVADRVVRCERAQFEIGGDAMRLTGVSHTERGQLSSYREWITTQTRDELRIVFVGARSWDNYNHGRRATRHNAARSSKCIYVRVSVAERGVRHRFAGERTLRTAVHLRRGARRRRPIRGHRVDVAI